jgi:hypothetical protein
MTNGYWQRLPPQLDTDLERALLLTRKKGALLRRQTKNSFASSFTLSPLKKALIVARRRMGMPMSAIAVR